MIDCCCALFSFIIDTRTSIKDALCVHLLICITRCHGYSSVRKASKELQIPNLNEHAKMHSQHSLLSTLCSLQQFFVAYNFTKEIEYLM